MWWFPSFLNLCRTFTNDFVSTNHKTHCDFSFSVNIINSVQRRQRRSDWHWDVVTLSDD
jgi:hypothetical protein